MLGCVKSHTEEHSIARRANACTFRRITDIEKHCMQDHVFWIMCTLEINRHEWSSLSKPLWTLSHNTDPMQKHTQTLRQNPMGVIEFIRHPRYPINYESCILIVLQQGHWKASSWPTKAISQKLFARLWRKGLHLITGVRRNMKNYLMPIWDKVLLRKGFIIETLFDKLKSQMGLEHTRHRSPTNAFVHILSWLTAYMLGKTKIKMKIVA